MIKSGLSKTEEEWLAYAASRISHLRELFGQENPVVSALAPLFIKHLYHFSQDAQEQTSPLGSERADIGTAHERGGSATAKIGERICVDCKKSFVPRTDKATRCLDCWKKANPRMIR